ncbi:hypothetical protein DIPPA_26839 [Diplonema papillatum]|nr:hypothetical protein DIPPA_26839 [Diplonema papillatum]
MMLLYRALLVVVTLAVFADAMCGRCNSECGRAFEGDLSGNSAITIHEQYSRYLFTADCEYVETVSDLYPQLQIDEVTWEELTGANDYEGTLGLLSDMLYTKSPQVELMSLDEQWTMPLREYLEPIPESMLTHVKEKFVYRHTDGKAYGITHRSNQVVMYYRQDLFDIHGITLPLDSWANWEAAVMQLQTAEQIRRSDPEYRALMYIHGGENVQMLVNMVSFLSGTKGGVVIEDDGHVSINSPNGIAVINMMKRWFGTIAHPKVRTEEQSRTVYDMMDNDEFAIGFLWTSYSTKMMETNKARGWNIKMMPLPGPDAAGCSGSFQMTLASHTRLKNLGYDMLERATSHMLPKTTESRKDQEPVDNRLYADEVEYNAWCEETNPMMCESMRGHPDFWSRMLRRPSLGCGILFDTCARIVRSVMDDAMTGLLTAEEAVVQMEKRLNVLLGNWDEAAFYDENDSVKGHTIGLIVVIAVSVVIGVALVLFMFSKIRTLRKTKHFTFPVSGTLAIAVLILFLVVQVIVVTEWNDAIRNVSRDLNKNVREATLLAAQKIASSSAKAQLKSSAARAQMKSTVEADLSIEFATLSIDPRSLMLMIDRETGKVAVSSDSSKQAEDVYITAGALSSNVSRWTRAALAAIDFDLENANVATGVTYQSSMDGEPVWINLDSVRRSNADDLDIGSTIPIKTLSYFMAYIVPESVILQTADDSLDRSINLSIILSIIGVLLLVLVSTAFTLPLIYLANDMELVREMRLDELSLDKKSRFTEVSSLLTGFQSMCRMLSEYKAFMPKTLFAISDSEGDNGSETQSDRDRTDSKTSGISNLSTSHVTPVKAKLNGVCVGNLASMKGVMMTVVILEQDTPAYKTNVDHFVAILSIVETIARDTNGLLFSFNTTRPGELQVSWGLVGAPLNTRLCIDRASSAAFRIREKVNSLREPGLMVCIGICLGRFLTGNIGSQNTRAFAVMGPGVASLDATVKSAQAAVRILGCSVIIADPDIARGAGFTFQTVDVARVNGRLLNLHKLVGASSAEMKEWMYELQDVEEARSSALSTFIKELLHRPDMQPHHIEQEVLAKTEEAEDVSIAAVLHVLAKANGNNCIRNCITLLHDAELFEDYLRDEDDSDNEDHPKIV